MTVTASQILTTESIPKYLEERWGQDDFLYANNNCANTILSADQAVKGMKVDTIQGGNVNYAFCLELPSLFHLNLNNNGGGDDNNGGDNNNNNNNNNNENKKKKLFLKQAPEFVAIMGDGPDGFPLTSERMQREMDVYKEWKTLLGEKLGEKYLPEIYYFDRKSMVVIMEFFDGYELLDHILVNKEGAANLDNIVVGSYLGDFMGKVHAATHSSNPKLTSERIMYLTSHFENREMRDVQLEFVFTKCYKEATDEQRSGLILTEEFMDEVELLKQQYNGTSAAGNDTLVLCHGDLHPGSVMVDPTTGSTKVIDPEFTVYGPAGLDVGSLLSGYCLGYIHQSFCCDNDDDDDNASSEKAKQNILDGAEAIWNSYKTAMMEDGNVTPAYIKAIEIETVGFTVAEVCRTAMEFAGGRKWLQFDNDPVRKANSKKAALQVVQNCMIGRHTGGIELLFSELKKAGSGVVE